MSAKDLGWVYVRFGNDYKDYPVLRKSKFNTLLEAVARSVGRDRKKLIEISKGTDGSDRETISWGETKKYIAQEATRIIERIARVDNGSHMALYSSKCQIKRRSTCANIQITGCRDIRWRCSTLFTSVLTKICVKICRPI